MEETLCCSCCGSDNSWDRENLQEIDLHCSHCGQAVKHWSCHRHSCEVLIWAKARRGYFCWNCTKSDIKVACEGNNISMLALSLSLELYYKCKGHLISDEGGDMLIDLWRKARISGVEFARAAAKEAATVALCSETADLMRPASERIETAARSRMADLARNQARARARASVSAIPPDATSNSCFTQCRPRRVQTSPLFTSDQRKENASASTRNSPVQQRLNSKESTGLTKKSCENQASILSQRTRRKRGIKSSNPLLCGCRCQ